MSIEWQVASVESVMGVGPAESYSLGHGTFEIQPWSVDNQVTNVGYVQTTLPWYHYCTCPTKSAREQVQDEILTKMAKAIESEDYKAAKELAKLAKAIKEL